MIDPQLSDDFKLQCDSVGRRQYKAIEAALRLWISLPGEIQSAVIENPNCYTPLISDYLRRQLQEAFRKLLAPPKQSGKNRLGND